MSDDRCLRSCLAVAQRGARAAALAAAEGVMRKLKAIVHSRTGPPLTQPYLDLLKLLGKEDLRTAAGVALRARRRR